MPVKIRLTRMGKKKQPSYRVVVMDSRKPRDGAYIEQIGRYDPRAEPSLVEIDNDKALEWLQRGAQPSDRVKKLLEISGAWTRFRVAKGDIHTIGEATPAPPPVAEAPPVPAPESVAAEAPDAPAVEPVTEAVAEAPVADEPAAVVEIAAAEPVGEIAAEAAEVTDEGAAAADEEPAAETGDEEEQA